MTKEGRIRTLAAVMFTDMVGYTALMQEDEQKAKENRDRHRKVLEESALKHRGRIVQYYGDGTLSIFGSAIEAARCAVEIQKMLRSEPKVPVRIGLHVGDVVNEEEGVYGDGVNVASRIESLSVPGGILVSERVFDDIKNHPELPAKSLGKFELKNVKRPVEVFALTNAGLAVPSSQELRTKTGPSFRSIAVLPFVNMSADAENEYFSDGISEELINALTRVDGLHVTSRTSSFAFKGKQEDIRQIGAQLNVSTVLEGSVRKAGDKVRITAQLVNTADGYHVWSEVFDRRLQDIFEVQDEISRKIANRMREKLAGSEIKEPLVRSHTRDLEAYNLHLKGLYYWNKWTPEDINKALQCFEEAIQKDPDFALPYAGLAWSYSYLGLMGQMPSREVFPKAKEAALKGLELDETLAETHVALGLVKMFYDWDWDGAFSSFDRALKLNPGAADVHKSYAMYLWAVGKLEEAVNESELAVQLDPLSLPIRNHLACAYLFAGQNDEAIEQSDKVLEMDPTFRSALEFKGMAYLQKGEIDRSIELFEEYQKLTKDPLKGMAGLGYAYARAGRLEEARECLEKLKRREQIDKNVGLSMDFAAIYAGLGDSDKVFYYLEKAYEQRYGILYLKCHPAWNDLRADPRFRNILKKIGLEK
ncbi:MAG: tetratricopeptide repeat protein [Bacteroidota bacterium]